MRKRAIPKQTEKKLRSFFATEIERSFRDTNPGIKKTIKLQNRKIRKDTIIIK